MKINRWIRLALSTLTLFFAGIIYSWSILKTPLADVFDAEKLPLAYTLALSFFCLGGLLGGMLGKRVSHKIRILAGAALFAGGFAITSRLTGESAVPLYLTYGVMVGLGIGIIYNAVIPATSAWFPDKKGVASGVMMMGFGLSTLGLGTLANALFETSLGWRGTFLTYGLALGALIAVAAFFIRPPRSGEAPSAAKTAGQSDADFTPKQMLARPSFWLLFAFLTLLGAIGSTAIGSAKQFMETVFESSASVAALSVSAVAVCNGLGRILCGALFDAEGMRRTQYVNCVIVLLAPLCAILAIKTGVTCLGFAALCLCGLTFGFAPTVTSAFVLGFYGSKNFSLNFPIMTLTLIPASFTSTITGGMTFLSTYILLLALAVTAAAINLLIKKA